MPVSVYYVYASQKRSKIQSAQKNPKKLQKFFFARRPREPEGQVLGRPTASIHHPGAAGARVAARSHLDSSCAASRCLFAYKFTPDLKTEGASTIFAEYIRGRHHRQNPNSGVRRSCSGTLPGWGLSPGAISFDYAASMMHHE